VIVRTSVTNKGGATSEATRWYDVDVSMHKHSFGGYIFVDPVTNLHTNDA
jgi:hypothetical protein